MKKFLFSLAAFIALGTGVFAADAVMVEDAIVIDDVEMVAGGTATVTVTLSEAAVNAAAAKSDVIRGMQVDIYLPEGFTAVEKSEGKVKTKRGADQDDYMAVGSNSYVDSYQHIRFILSNMEGTPLYKGVLFTFDIKAADDVVSKNYDVIAGGEYGNTSNVKFSGSNYSYEQVPFTFKIKMPLTLDETKDYAAFDASTGKVTVKRTISANNWNTICLPFDMTAEQLKAAFGENVQVASFTKCDTYKSGDKITGLGLKFSSVSAISAHTPYLIKVDAAVSTFTLDEATISDGTPSASGDGGTFVGTYKNITGLGTDAPVLFLSGNKFYIATGNSSLKSFRGYFDLTDLKDYYDANVATNANISIFVDDDQVTGINGVTAGQGDVDAVYDLQGRKIKVENNDLNTLQKGVYIINGQKVTVK